jgi:hypothetical protein
MPCKHCYFLAQWTFLFRWWCTGEGLIKLNKVFDIRLFDQGVMHSDLRDFYIDSFYLYLENCFLYWKINILISLCYQLWMHLMKFLLSLFMFSNNIDIVVSMFLRCSCMLVCLCISKPMVFTFIICLLMCIYGLWLVREKIYTNHIFIINIVCCKFHCYLEFLPRNTTLLVLWHRKCHSKESGYPSCRRYDVQYATGIGAMECCGVKSLARWAESSLSCFSWEWHMS